MLYDLILPGYMKKERTLLNREVERKKERVVHELSGLDDPMINGQRQHIARDIHITPVERYAT